MTYSMVSKTAEAQKWLDDVCRDVKLKLGLTDEEIIWLLMDFTTHLYFKTFIHKQRLT